MKEKLISEVNLITRIKLLFVRSFYTVDSKSVIRYKQLNGITYIMRRGTHLEEEK